MYYKDIIQSLKELDTKIELCESLTRANFNEETTYVFIEKHKFECESNKERLALLHEALTKEKVILKAKLEEIARTFNDNELEVFNESIVKKKDLQKVADELGMSYGYVRVINSNIKKKLKYNEQKEKENNNNEN